MLHRNISIVAFLLFGLLAAVPGQAQTNAGPHAVTSINTASGCTLGAGCNVNGVQNPNYAYDANGNMIGGAGRTVTYSSFDMATQIKQGAITESYAYDSEHSRIQQTAPEGTTTYLNDPISGAKSEAFVSGSTTTWRDYVESDDRIVAERFNTAGTVSILYFNGDELGSTSVLTNGTAAIQERDSYDAWGKPRNPNGTDLYPCTMTSATTHGFTGQEQVADVCLDNYNARFYDPVIGRFMAPDSVIPDTYSPQSLNRYTYVENGPLSFTDPTGHDINGNVGNPQTYPGNVKIIGDGGTSIVIVGVGGLTYSYVVSGSGDTTGSSGSGSPPGANQNGIGNPAPQPQKTSDGQSSTAPSDAGAAQAAQAAASNAPNALIGGDQTAQSYGSGQSDKNRVQVAQFDPGGSVEVGMDIGSANMLYDAGYSQEKIASTLSRQQSVEANALLIYTPGGDVGEAVTVYRALSNESKVLYVGITNSLVKRAAAHLAEKGIRIRAIPGLSELSRADARATEQALIELYGLGKNGGSLINKINSIARANPIYAAALARGREILINAKYPGL